MSMMDKYLDYFEPALKKEIMPQIQIQIINVALETRMTKANKPYEVVEVTFKNLTFQGKVESKKLMPFGDTTPAAASLKGAQNGEVYDITWQKDASGQYNNWTSANKGGAGAPQQASASPPSAPTAAAPARAGGWQGETAEERAAKQVYIIKQSSISAAVNALSTGSKVAPDADVVISYAQKLVDYVFSKDKLEPDNASGFDNMDDDVPL